MVIAANPIMTLDDGLRYLLLIGADIVIFWFWWFVMSHLGDV